MSKQYNNAGRSLIVDEVVELNGKYKDPVPTLRQQLDAQLIRRDTAAIKAQVSLIGADNHVSVAEKLVLSREYEHIASNHGVLVAKAEEWGITDQTGYQEYLGAYQGLSSYLDVLLTDMTTGSDIPSHQEMESFFSELYRTSSVLEEQFFRYTTGMLGGLDWRVKFEVVVNSSLGLTVPTDNTPTTLSVMLLREGEDVTDEYDATAFSWERISEDRIADSSWRNGLDLSGKTIGVSFEDLVYGAASFMCHFRYQYSDTMYYSKSGFITLSKEVAGPPGEDAYQVQVVSERGLTFRMGEPFSTTMHARVWRGGLEITDLFEDSDFRWYRTSNDAYADSVWNSAHYSSGGKSLTITQEDVVGRSNFFCELLRERS